MYRKGGDGMIQKAIMFRAYNGMEIIDARPEAEIAYENMCCAKIIKALQKYYQHCFR